MRVNRAYLRLCLAGMAVQAAVGVVGFSLHLLADLHGVGPTLLDRIIYGAPVFAPMLFPDMVILTLIGMWVPYQRLEPSP